VNLWADRRTDFRDSQPIKPIHCSIHNSVDRFLEGGVSLEEEVLVEGVSLEEGMSEEGVLVEGVSLEEGVSEEGVLLLDGGESLSVMDGCIS
jgi:hypothetical protein